MKICIVGAGWYGSHIAIVLKKAGHEVTLVEKNDKIFKGVSGDRGIRLHAGPHYPRSEQTRKRCHINLERFKLTYPDLVIPHQYSIYGLGDKDANLEASKIGQLQFDAVCQETSSQKINPSEWGYKNLLSAFNVEEPSITGGEKLREAFTRYLNEAGVKVVCNFNVQKLEQTSEGITVTDGKFSETFDFVINSTCFQSLLPEDKHLPLDIEAVYQPCLALVYRDKLETVSKPPLSFIVMDGAYPCMMPYNERYNGTLEKDAKGEPYRMYMLTHGKWTIMASCKTHQESEKILHQLDNEFIENFIKPKCSSEMARFWPEFESRFEYVGWTGSTLAKLKTEKEFRGAFSYAEIERQVVHVFPGKVGCIFSVADEVVKLINGKQEDIIEQNGYKFAKDGVLHESLEEVTEKPHPQDYRNTANLQTYMDLITSNKSTNTLISDTNDSLKSLKGLIQSSHPIWAPIQNKSLVSAKHNLDQSIPLQSSILSL